MKKQHKNLWTTQQFLNLSNSLSHAFGISADDTTVPAEQDEWTAEKLIQFSNSLSQGYNAGL